MPRPQEGRASRGITPQKAELGSRLGLSALSTPLVLSLGLTGTKTGPPLLPLTEELSTWPRGCLNPKWSSPYLRPLAGEREWVNAASCVMGTTELRQGSEGGVADTEGFNCVPRPQSVLAALLAP